MAFYTRGGRDRRPIPIILLPVSGAPDTVDDLLAEDVQSASEVSTPVIGQIHVLLANDVQSTSNVSTPAFGQAHVLNANDVQSTSELTAPTCTSTGVHTLLAEDVQSTSQVSSPVVGQVHVLNANDVESASEVSRPVLAEVGVTPPVAASKVGRSSPQNKRRHYVVEVDGQLIQVATQADILAVLQQASEIAEEQADIIEPPRIKVRTSTGKPVESKTVVAAIQQTQRRISKAHDEAKKRHEVDREISRLILKAIERQNEEDDIITMLVA